MDKTISEINRKFPGIRDIERWECNQFTYPSVDEFCKPDKFEFGIHTIFDGTLPIDVHINLKENLPLIICLNGALATRDDDLKLPVFSGFGVIPSAQASVVRINDPSLYTSRSLKLAWYGGAAGMDLSADLQMVLDKIIAVCTPSNVIFFGGSGGGFASLNLSRRFPGSIAIVWNPQTDLLKFDKGALLEYASSAFGIKSFEECQLKLPSMICHSVQRYYNKGTQTNYVLFMQNKSDWHVRWHSKPFLEATGLLSSDEFVSKRLDGQFYLHVGDWGEGHAPPSREFQKYLISSILDRKVSASELFAGDVLAQILLSAESLSDSL